MPKDHSLDFDPIERAFQSWKEHWGESTSMLAITSVMRAQQLLLARVDAIVKPYELTFARYEALVLLTFSRAARCRCRRSGSGCRCTRRR